MIISVKPEHSVKEGKISKLIRIVYKYGFITGSKKFKLDNKNSDIDIVVMLPKIIDLINLKCLEEYNDNCHLPCSNLKIEIHDKIINIIVAENEAIYNSWVKSTNDFLQLLKNDIFKKVMENKDTRVSFFEELRSINGLSNK